MRKIIITASMFIILLVSSCQPIPIGGSSSESIYDDDALSPTATSILDTAKMFTDRDSRVTYDGNDTTSIIITGDKTITKEGVYIVSGTANNAQIIVDAGDSAKVQLILDGVYITSSDSAALYVKSANKVFVTTKTDTTNTISNNGMFITSDDSVDGAVFSKSDITFNGDGVLNITSTHGHGIVGKDDVVFYGGNYNITAKSHGISANDSIRIATGNFNISSTKDAMQADNEDATKGYVYIKDGDFSITATQDFIDASGSLQIDGGIFTVTTGGGFDEVLNEITIGEGAGGITQPTDLLEYSSKCFKSYNMLFGGGIFDLSSYEDAIHANNDLIINGGTFDILTGDDGVHADNNLTINSGIINIKNGYEGIEAGLNLTINDGEIYVVVLDDAINVGASNGILKITGGKIYISSQGDGLDSNGSFSMSGGILTIEVDAIYSGGDGNIDITGDVSFTGGTITDGNGNNIDPTVSSGGMEPGCGPR